MDFTQLIEHEKNLQRTRARRWCHMVADQAQELSEAARSQDVIAMKRAVNRLLEVMAEEGL